MRFRLLFLVLALCGCAEVQEINRRKAILNDMVRTNAAERSIRQEMPGLWLVYDKTSVEGQEFGASLLNKKSPDLADAKEAWKACDRAFYHTTESSVTLVFVKTNTVFSYYIGTQ